jgi:threonine dehydrogenase-like Zn-dependent dehydrogenase
VIRVLSTGICASDIKCYDGAAMFWGDGKNPGYCQPPVTPGHEFVGEVVALGEGAGEKYQLAIGDRAVSEQIVPCGHCRYCQRGQYWMCAVHDIYGFRQKTFGAWAEYMLFSGRGLELQGAEVDPDAPCGFHRAAGLLASMPSSAVTSNTRTWSSSPVAALWASA